MSGMGIVGFCDYLNLTPNFVDSTSIGGSSFVAHTAHAAAALHAGLCDVCVVVYGSTAAVVAIRDWNRLRSRHEVWGPVRSV